MGISRTNGDGETQTNDDETILALGVEYVF